jgi:hypothetical protein
MDTLVEIIYVFGLSLQQATGTMMAKFDFRGATVGTQTIIEQQLGNLQINSKSVLPGDRSTRRRDASAPFATTS